MFNLHFIQMRTSSLEDAYKEAEDMVREDTDGDENAHAEVLGHFSYDGTEIEPGVSGFESIEDINTYFREELEKVGKKDEIQDELICLAKGDFGEEPQKEVDLSLLYEAQSRLELTVEAAKLKKAHPEIGEEFENFDARKHTFRESQYFEKGVTNGGMTDELIDNEEEKEGKDYLIVLRVHR